MPTRYKPETDHKPVDWEAADLGEKDAEIGRLIRELRSNDGRIIEAFRASGVVLEFDDVEPLLVRLQVILVKFVAECRAHPLRTARQLLPTVVQIRRDPESFLADVDKYSPEAVALVYAMYLRLLPDRRDLQAFEAGDGPAPEAADVALAADAAIVLLEQEAEAQGRGRPKMRLVEDLAVALGKQFSGLGGRLGRWRQRDGVERGVFLDFLEAVVAPARTLVKASGYSLNPETMVRQAQDALLPKSGS